MNAMSYLTSLVSLDLFYVKPLTAKGLRCLKPLSRLAALDITHCRVRDDGIEAIADLPLTSLVAQLFGNTH